MSNFRVLDSDPASESSYVTLEFREDSVLEDSRNPFIDDANASTITSRNITGGTHFEELIQQITSSFNDTVRALALDRDQPKRKKTPFHYTFSGENYEDPSSFLAKLNRYFTNSGIRDDDEKVTILDNQLRGEAKDWRAPYQHLDESYAEVCYRFTNYFNSTEKTSAAMAVLYGTKQRSNEKTTPFITKKQGLFNRLAPETGTSFRVDLILNQLDCEIRSRLRGRKFEEVEELITAAAHVENDLAQRNPNNARRPYASRENQTENFPNGAGEDRNRNRPPSPCRFCGEWHYQTHCPRNPYRHNTTNPDQRGEIAPPRPNTSNGQAPRNDPQRDQLWN